MSSEYLEDTCGIWDEEGEILCVTMFRDFIQTSSLIFREVTWKRWRPRQRSSESRKCKLKEWLYLDQPQQNVHFLVGLFPKADWQCFQPLTSILELTEHFWNPYLVNAKDSMLWENSTSMALISFGLNINSIVTSASLSSGTPWIKVLGLATAGLVTGRVDVETSSLISPSSNSPSSSSAADPGWSTSIGDV
ncbi:hypothetical protein PM082_011896 [Marasmius tenuissimus]|nr:hypothetical protein PM082_011896 [Marasmius tenuissimus]